MINLYAVIVIYNKKLEKSLTISNILKLKLQNIKIIVIDNSTDITLKNDAEAEKLNIFYISMNGNKGLSKAYNIALDKIENKTEKDFIIWLDDDTDITIEYFDELMNAASNMEYQVFMPIVIGQNGVIYSPNNAGLLKSKLINNINETNKIKKFNGINSCLAVRASVYKDYRYDERLFMDAVDNKLFDDFREMNLKFFVLSSIIHQNFFQRASDVTIEKLWFRFENRIKDTMIYCDRSMKYNCIGLIRACGWGLQNGLKFKSISFIKNCVSLGFKLFWGNCINLIKK